MGSVPPQEDMNMAEPPLDGVEQGEEEDLTASGDSPKKNIQRLTGKLSQALNTYNETEEEDTELNKYVAGMIIPQASKGMTDNDKEQIINKIKSGNVDDGSEMEDIPMDDSEQEIGEEPKGMNNEAYNHLKKTLNEILNDTFMSEVDKESEEERKEKKSTNKDVKNNNPFKSNR